MLIGSILALVKCKPVRIGFGSKRLMISLPTSIHPPFVRSFKGIFHFFRFSPQEKIVEVGENKFDLRQMSQTKWRDEFSFLLQHVHHINILKDLDQTSHKRRKRAKWLGKVYNISSEQKIKMSQWLFKNDKNCNSVTKPYYKQTVHFQRYQC